MPEPKVVDSWAMVAWVRDEPAAPIVESLFQKAQAGNVELVMSWLNVAETFYSLAKRNSPALADEFMVRLRSYPFDSLCRMRMGSWPQPGSRAPIQWPLGMLLQSHSHRPSRPA